VAAEYTAKQLRKHTRCERRRALNAEKRRRKGPAHGGRCPWCGGQQTWCAGCEMWSSYCCEEYGTCMCS
jgi:hypothetical protein